jgi:hypothetical protein
MRNEDIGSKTHSSPGNFHRVLHPVLCSAAGRAISLLVDCAVTRWTSAGETMRCFHQDLPVDKTVAVESPRGPQSPDPLPLCPVHRSRKQSPAEECHRPTAVTIHLLVDRKKKNQKNPKPGKGGREDDVSGDHAPVSETFENGREKSDTPTPIFDPPPPTACVQPPPPLPDFD